MVAFVVGVWLVVAPATAGVLVDRVAAVVDKDVITHAELVMEARVALALRRGDAVFEAELTDDFLGAFRDYLITQLLIAAQARRFGAPEVAEAEVDRALRTLVARFRSESSYQAFLRRYGVSDSTLREILRRDLRSARYIDLRVRARLSSEQDAAARARYEDALMRWVAELRAGADVRLPGPTGVLERQEADVEAFEKRVTTRVPELVP